MSERIERLTIVEAERNVNGVVQCFPREITRDRQATNTSNNSRCLPVPPHGASWVAKPRASEVPQIAPLRPGQQEERLLWVGPASEQKPARTVLVWLCDWRRGRGRQSEDDELVGACCGRHGRTRERPRIPAIQQDGAFHHGFDGGL